MHTTAFAYMHMHNNNEPKRKSWFRYHFLFCLDKFYEKKLTIINWLQFCYHLLIRLLGGKKATRFSVILSLLINCWHYLALWLTLAYCTEYWTAFGEQFWCRKKNWRGKKFTGIYDNLKREENKMKKKEKKIFSSINISLFNFNHFKNLRKQNFCHFIIIIIMIIIF